MAILLSNKVKSKLDKNFTISLAFPYAKSAQIREIYSSLCSFATIKGSGLSLLSSCALSL
jgi:hypothetical protein